MGDAAESAYDEASIGCCGSLKLAVSFDANLSILTVALKQAMDLIARRQVSFNL
jgi:hypothetical protein